MPPAPIDSLARACVAVALDALGREYPCKVVHVFGDADDVLAPSGLAPVFHGCFDWHSAVHAHWTLARCCRHCPDAAFQSAARAHLRKRITDTGIAAEVARLERPENAGVERPYGLAWLLLLALELREWADDDAIALRRTLAPLEDLACRRLLEWLPRLTAPIRTGEHSQSAFGMALALDWARGAGHDALRDLVVERAHDFHGDDAGWSFAFEPSGHDFLSPGLAAADLMRRVLDAEAFAAWLSRALPEPGQPHAMAARLAPAVVTDRTDGKLVHLAGLNLSRAWMLEGIAHALPSSDPRRPMLTALAAAHAEPGLAALANDHFASTHWLGSFAIYLATRRGIDGGVTPDPPA